MTIENKFDPGDIIYVPVEVKEVKIAIEKDKSDTVKYTHKYILAPDDKTVESDLQRFSMNGNAVESRAITQKEAFKIRMTKDDSEEFDCNSCIYINDEEGTFCYECSKGIQNNYTPSDYTHTGETK